MSGAKHTPGPWSYNQWRETDGDGELMALGWQIITSGGLLPLCAQTGDMDEAEANARLIAAAPELLDALQVLHDNAAELIAHLQATDRLRPCFNLPALDSARAAVAKATGSDHE